MVGMVRRSAAGLEDGVEGRVGGTLNSSPCIRLVEFLCDLARDAAVGASYRESLDPPAEGVDPEPDAWDWLASIREDNDALRVSLRVVEGGVGGLRTECDFWLRRLPGFGERKFKEDDAEGAEERAWNVCERVGLRRGGDGDSRSF